MAIYVYKTADGSLYSEIPDNLTIAQAQATGQLASSDVLTANGLAAIDGQAPLTHGNPEGSTIVVWNPTTKTTVTQAAPTPPKFLPTYQFVNLFTDAEHAAILAAATPGQTSFDPKVSKFMMMVQSVTAVNLNDPMVQGAINYLVSINLLTSANAALILSGQPSQ